MESLDILFSVPDSESSGFLFVIYTSGLYTILAVFLSNPCYSSTMDDKGILTCSYFTEGNGVDLQIWTEINNFIRTFET